MELCKAIILLLKVFTWCTLASGINLGANLTCAEKFHVAWTNQPPLVFMQSGQLSGAFHTLLLDAISRCCGNNTRVHWNAPKDNYDDVESELEDEDIAIPVSRLPGILPVDSIIDSWDFVPLVESPRTSILSVI